MRIRRLQFVLLLSLILGFIEKQLGEEVNHAALSLTKGGGIRIGACDFEKELFHSSVLSEWSCEDATTFTWRQDFENLLGDFHAHDRERLAASAGYCPHRRCQLGNASSSDTSEKCPPGLCYTKIENGRPSFGACCFTNSFFESHSLLGYYHKSQPIPKPIYKRNRVVLGGDSHDSSFNAFINANEIGPGLIAAQCPMTGYPAGFANTVEDMKKMLVEQDVGLWIQLSPYSENGELVVPLADGTMKSYCDVVPLRFFGSSSDEYIKHKEGVSNYSYVQNKDEGFINMTYTLTAYVRKNKRGIVVDSTFDMGEIEGNICTSFCAMFDSGWEIKISKIEHLWFYKWDDFTVPQSEYFGPMNSFADRTVSFIRQGNRAVITCFSGRGRTGTFAAIVLSKFWKRALPSYGVTSRHEDNSIPLVSSEDQHFHLNVSNSLRNLVDIIVDMRKSRDGLVETPRQLKFILDVLTYGDLQ